jgi:hypothetical protein
MSRHETVAGGLDAFELSVRRPRARETVVWRGGLLAYRPES